MMWREVDKRIRYAILLYKAQYKGGTMRIKSVIRRRIPSNTISHSHFNGFTVTKGKKTVSSQGYDPNIKRETELTKKHLLVWCGVWIFYSSFLMFLFLSQNPIMWQGIVVGLILIILALGAAKCLTFLLFVSDLTEKDTREYHACEHKVLHLLQKKSLEPTLKNLKKMPLIDSSCGTNFIGVIAISPFLIGCLIFLENIFSQTTIGIFRYVVYIVVYGLAIFASNFLFQPHTRDIPSEKKLKEALEVAQEFFK
ncbi:DUF1385 domain-containing protein [Patescibacteria group bacterium AH-259-L05]|nr:DUF1385 domain-containing protein [Patescibacteria group bacterium AH-259-L05]